MSITTPNYHGFATEPKQLDKLMNKIKSGDYSKVKVKPVSEKEYKQATQKFARDYPRNQMLKQAQNNKKEKVKIKPKRDNKKFLRKVEKALKKRFSNKRILKKSRAVYKMPNKPVGSYFNQGSHFFNDEWEREINSFINPIKKDETNFIWD